MGQPKPRSYEWEAAAAPSVIEPETFGTEDDQAPTQVWIPTASVTGEMNVDQATIEAVASELHHGADELSAAPEPPLPIEAGRVTGALAALGAHLTGTMQTLTGRLGGTAEQVTTAGATFAEVDQEAASALTPAEKEAFGIHPVPPGTPGLF